MNSINLNELISFEDTSLVAAVPSGREGKNDFAFFAIENLIVFN